MVSIKPFPNDDEGRPVEGLLPDMACRWHNRGGTERRNLARDTRGFLVCRDCDTPDSDAASIGELCPTP